MISRQVRSVGLGWFYKFLIIITYSMAGSATSCKVIDEPLAEQAQRHARVYLGKSHGGEQTHGYSGGP